MKDKKTYKVPVVWSMMGYVEVEAASPEEAYQQVKDHPEKYPLPEGSYLEDSFETAYDNEESVEQID